MLQTLNKFCDRRIKAPLNSRRGQVTVVIILVLAIALIFYAVSLNLGLFVMPRTMTSIASNSAASLLASDMSSYGQYLSETNLGGRRKVCGWTGVLAIIITIILIIILIIISIYAPPAAPGLWATILGSTEFAVAGLVFAVAALIIQLAVIQPGITEAWNSIIMEFLSQRNQFTEGAIQMALSKIVTDPVQVPDFGDSDRDLSWQPFDDLNPDPPFVDEISRYAVYYTWRLNQISTDAASSTIGDFLEALRELLYRGSDQWGLWDPMPSNLCLGMAECHPCCTPAEATIIDGGSPTTVSVRDALACIPDDELTVLPGLVGETWESLCTKASPYQLDPPGAYPYLFDLYFENPFNGFESFREQLGRDDEHQYYYKDPLDPNSFPVGGDPARPSQIPEPVGYEGFRLEDTTGYYDTDSLSGIFPFFYKMRDWGMELLTVQKAVEDGDALFTTGAARALSATTRECHWCDFNWDPACFQCNDPGPHPHPSGELPQLSLPIDPSLLTYDTSAMVDGASFDRTTNLWTYNDWDTNHKPPVTLQPWPSTAVDRVSLPSNIFAADDACAVNAIYNPPATDMGFWKGGMDRFCKEEAPYFLQCPKCKGDENCDCTEPAGNFHDDTLDKIIYGLPDFFEWAVALLETGTDLTLSEKFKDWYPEAAVWIEPAADNPDGLPCYMCDHGGLVRSDGTPLYEGFLWVWLKEAIGIRDRVRGWIYNTNMSLTPHEDEGYGGAVCTDVWCVPISHAVDSCPDISPEGGEYATFDTNVDGVFGDVEDVVGCLNYNVNGYDHVAAEKFKTCRDNCNLANCQPGAALPEYYLDGVTPYEYPAELFTCTDWGGALGENVWYDAIIENMARATNPSALKFGNDFRFRECATTCSLEACHHLPRSIVPYAEDAEYYPDGKHEGVVLPFPTDYEPPKNAATADGDWLDLTAFNDCLNTCNAESCNVTTRLPAASVDAAVVYSYPIAPLSCAGWGVGNTWYDAIVANKNSLLTARGLATSETDLAAMLACFWNCPACPGLPAAYAWPGPVPACAGNFPDKPSGWHQAFVDNIKLAGGRSCDVDYFDDPLIPDGWLYSTGMSAIEAINQVAKFEYRRDFLQARLEEALEILEILGEEDSDPDGNIDNGFGFIGKLDSFLRGPAADLIQLRISWGGNPPKKGLPYQAVYGWKDESEFTDEGVEIPGLWHIVKVEARVPGMCDDGCGYNQTSKDPDWPKIITYTKNFGTKRCYELVNTEGLVKFRTTRWDQDKEKGGLLTFPNGTPIWNFRTNHPDRVLDTDKYNPNSLDGVCANVSGPEPPTGGLDHVLGTNLKTEAYEGAFIMNKRLTSDTWQKCEGLSPCPSGCSDCSEGSPDAYFLSPSNNACWDLVHHLLPTGVANETCAQYYWHEGSNEGMGMKFVRCQDF